jgi:peptidoglycan/xylan/chitin deacetylase (PgdA/CDA1 family)
MIFSSVRVADATGKILEILDMTNTKATFFCLSIVAQNRPHMIALIAAQGHEMASHEWDYKNISTFTYTDFCQDITRTCDILESITG